MSAVTPDVPSAAALARLRRRARVAWWSSWVLLAVLIAAQVVAFMTGWIYESILRLLSLPASCFLFLGWMAFSTRWVLAAVPDPGSLPRPHAGRRLAMIYLATPAIVLLATLLGLDDEKSLFGLVLLVVLPVILVVGSPVFAVAGFTGAFRVLVLYANRGDATGARADPNFGLRAPD